MEMDLMQSIKPVRCGVLVAHGEREWLDGGGFLGHDSLEEEKCTLQCSIFWVWWCSVGGERCLGGIRWVCI